MKVLIDGVPQNAPGGAYDFANLTTDNVERIEVVRGPASVLYGSDAVTGVVQIFTRDGRGPAHGAVTVGGGTYGSSALDATLAGGGERAGYSAGVSRFTSDGVYPFNNQYRNEVLNGRVRLRPDGQTDAALSLRYGDPLYHFPTDGGGDPVSHNQHQVDRGPSVGLDLGRTFSRRLAGRIKAPGGRVDVEVTRQVLRVGLLEAPSAGQRKRPHQRPVVSLRLGDDPPAALIPAVDVVLAHQPQRGLVGLRATGHESHPGHLGR